MSIIGSLQTKPISRVILGVFFVMAGANHFINPAFYVPLIPPYLPWHELINVTSGVIEIILGVGVLLKSTSRLAAMGIILLMVAFIPSHVYFVQEGSCIGQLCVAPWIGWVRLVVIHPMLIGWVWWHSR